MKLGCRAHDQGRMPAAELAALLQKKGYTACQLAMPKALEGIENYRQVTPDMAAEIGAKFAESGVEISVLGCYMDLSTPDEEARRAAVENITCCLKLQKEMGAVCVGSESSYLRLDEEEKRRRYPLLEDSVLRIAEQAAKYEGVFAIEPVFWHPLDSVERTCQLLDTVQDPQHVRLIFDAANVLKRRDQPRQTELWKEWLDALGSRITAMHIKDFVLEKDTYVSRALGQGVMDYTAISQWLKSCGSEIALLREEVQLEQEKADLDFMKGLLFG